MYKHETEWYRKDSFLPEFLYHIYLFIYLFVFPGVVTIFYIKFTFDRLQYKLWNFKFIHYGTGKKKDSIIESIVDIGKERTENL